MFCETVGSGYTPLPKPRESQMSVGQPDFISDREIGSLCVGRGTYWDESTRFQTYSDGERIRIGRYCSIAAGVFIATGGEHRVNTVSTWPFDNFLRSVPNPSRTYKPIRDTMIGSDVWIGQGAHIAGGAQVGHGAVIGASAVVMSDVPPYAIVVGNRAEVVRHRFEGEVIAALLDIAWWDWSPEKIETNIELFYGDVHAFIAEHCAPSPPACRPSGRAAL